MKKTKIMFWCLLTKELNKGNNYRNVVKYGKYGTNGIVNHVPVKWYGLGGWTWLFPGISYRFWTKPIFPGFSRSVQVHLKSPAELWSLIIMSSIIFLNSLSRLLTEDQSSVKGLDYPVLVWMQGNKLSSIVRWYTTIWFNFRCIFMIFIMFNNFINVRWSNIFRSAHQSMDS